MVRIISFDPSSTKMGYAVLDWDSKTGMITVVDVGTLHGQKLEREKRKQLGDVLDKRMTLLYAYGDIVEELFLKYKPDEVVSESPFQYKFPAAFGSLTLIVNCIARKTWEVLGKMLHTIAPMAGKKGMTGRGDAKKDDVQHAIETDPLLSYSGDWAKIDDNGFDAVGVGVAFLRTIYPALLATRIQI